MKKITLLTAVAFTAIASHAQITKGSTFIGGAVGGHSQKDKSEDQNSKAENSQWAVGLEFGKFFADNKAVGLFVNYGTGHSKQTYGSTFPSSSESEIKGFNTGVFYRQYFPLSTKWYLFGEADLGYGKNKSENKSNDKRTSKSDEWNIGASITPGVSFAAGRRLFVEAAFSSLLYVRYGKSESKNYNTSTGAVTSTSKGKDLNASANTSGFNNIQFGLRWILPGKKK